MMKGFKGDKKGKVGLKNIEYTITDEKRFIDTLGSYHSSKRTVTVKDVIVKLEKYIDIKVNHSFKQWTMFQRNILISHAEIRVGELKKKLKDMVLYNFDEGCREEK